MQLFYRRAEWRVKTAEKKIYLSFDDGPHPEITNWVLDVLKEYNGKATFFCVGENVRKHSEVYKRILNENHSVGNHTYNHVYGWRTDTKNYVSNVERCAEIMNLSSIIHLPSSITHPLFRPPYGKMKPSQYSILNTQYSIVMWDVLSGDFDNKITKEKCLQNCVDYSREGTIIVFHDSQKAKANLEFALPKFLKHFSEIGFSFEKL